MVEGAKKEYPKWKTTEEFWAWVDKEVERRLAEKQSRVGAPEFSNGAPAGI